jgi:hypothetical protein
MGRATGPFCCDHLQPGSVIAGGDEVSLGDAVWLEIGAHVASLLRTLYHKHPPRLPLPRSRA